MKTLSVSQIKKFMKSPSQWAGQYILGIKDEFESDALAIGSAFHKYAETKNKQDGIDILEKSMFLDRVLAFEQYDTLCANLDKFEIPKGETEVKAEFELWGVPFVGYIDLLCENEIIDFKSVSSLSKVEDKPAMRQAVSNYDEYMLQAYVYMKATGKLKARFIEVMKKTLKTRPDEYGQVIEFEYSEDMDSFMTEKYKPIVDQISSFYNTYSYILGH